MRAKAGGDGWLSALPVRLSRSQRASPKPQRASPNLFTLALMLTGTFAVCGVKAPPRPPLAESARAPAAADAGVASAGADAGSTPGLSCPAEAREEYARARAACGDDARLREGCVVTCAPDSSDGGAP
jgi:hypothetical protein